MGLGILAMRGGLELMGDAGGGVRGYDGLSKAEDLNGLLVVGECVSEVPPNRTINGCDKNAKAKEK